MQLTSEAYESDQVFPLLLITKLLSKLSLAIHLDDEKPVPEAKWVKTGEAQKWITSTFSQIFSDAGGGREKVQDTTLASQHSFQTATLWADISFSFPRHRESRSTLDGPTANGNVCPSDQTSEVHENTSIRDGQRSGDSPTSNSWGTSE